MSSRILYLLILCMMMSSCSEPETIVPADLIPEDEFVEILVDLNLIEAVRSMHITQEHAAKSSSESFYNGLWEEKGIDEERFERSFDYYRKDPEKLAEIYQRTADLLKREEDLINQVLREDAEERDQR